MKLGKGMGCKDMSCLRADRTVIGPGHSVLLAQLRCLYSEAYSIYAPTSHRLCSERRSNGQQARIAGSKEIKTRWARGTGVVRLKGFLQGTSKLSVSNASLGQHLRLTKGRGGAGAGGGIIFVPPYLQVDAVVAP